MSDDGQDNAEPQKIRSFRLYRKPRLPMSAGCLKVFVFTVIAVFVVYVVGRVYFHYADIHEAARNGDIDKIKICLFLGRDIDAGSFLFNTTPLAEAVRAGQKETVQFLLENGTATVRVAINPRLCTRRRITSQPRD